WVCARERAVVGTVPAVLGIFAASSRHFRGSRDRPDTERHLNAPDDRTSGSGVVVLADHFLIRCASLIWRHATPAPRGGCRWGILQCPPRHVPDAHVKRLVSLHETRLLACGTRR